MNQRRALWRRLFRLLLSGDELTLSKIELAPGRPDNAFQINF